MTELSIKDDQLSHAFTFKHVFTAHSVVCVEMHAKLCPVLGHTCVSQSHLHGINTALSLTSCTHLKIWIKMSLFKGQAVTPHWTSQTRGHKLGYSVLQTKIRLTAIWTF